MSFIIPSIQVRLQWFHRLYQIVSITLLISSIVFFLYSSNCYFHAQSVVDFSTSALEKAENKNYSDKDSPGTNLTNLIDFTASQYYINTTQNIQNWNDKVDKYTLFLEISFLPWIALFLLYRGMLYVCFGKSAFFAIQKDNEPKELSE